MLASDSPRTDVASAPSVPEIADRRPGDLPVASGAAGELAAIAGDIKLAHTVFAMPFALLAAFLAAMPWVASGEGGRIAPPSWARFAGQLGLVILAMVFARTAAMVANRILDRDIDAANERTARRALPAGRLTVRSARIALGASAGLFMVVCAAFLVCFDNPWPLGLGLPVLGWICAYGFFKRFTALCHVYLGSGLAIGPIAAAIAIDPAQVVQGTLWLLAAMVLCWVAGFDVIYALQDVDADRRQGLHSMPSRWGVPAAMWASRGLHAVAATCLWMAVFGDPRFGAAMVVAAAIMTALLVVEHATVARWGSTRMALSFFTLNGVISCVVGTLGIVDLVMR